MKKALPVLSLLLLLIITLSVLRFFIFNSYLQAQKKTFIEQALRTARIDAEKLLVPDDRLYKDGNGFEWKENNRELVLNGRHYEIVCIKKCLQGNLLTLVEDEAENGLLTAFHSTGGKTDFSGLMKVLLGFIFITGFSGLAIFLAGSARDFTFFGSPKRTPIFTTGLIKPPRRLPENLLF